MFARPAAEKLVFASRFVLERKYSGRARTNPTAQLDLRSLTRSKMQSWPTASGGIIQPLPPLVVDFTSTSCPPIFKSSKTPFGTCSQSRKRISNFVPRYVFSVFSRSDRKYRAVRAVSITSSIADLKKERSFSSKTSVPPTAVSNSFSRAKRSPKSACPEGRDRYPECGKRLTPRRVPKNSSAQQGRYADWLPRL